MGPRRNRSPSWPSASLARARRGRGGPRARAKGVRSCSGRCGGEVDRIGGAGGKGRRGKSPPGRGTVGSALPFPRSRRGGAERVTNKAKPKQNQSDGEAPGWVLPAGSAMLSGRRGSIQVSGNEADGLRGCALVASAPPLRSSPCSAGGRSAPAAIAGRSRRPGRVRRGCGVNSRPRPPPPLHGDERGASGALPKGSRKGSARWRRGAASKLISAEINLLVADGRPFKGTTRGTEGLVY